MAREYQKQLPPKFRTRDEAERRLSGEVNRLIADEGRPFRYALVSCPSVNIGLSGGATDPGRDTDGHLVFDGTLSSESIANSFVLPHGWEEQSSVTGIIRWSKTTAATGAVQWLTRYRWSNAGATLTAYSSTLTAIVAVSISDVVDFLGVAEFTISAPSLAKIGSLLIVEVSRDPAGANDTYADDAKLWSLDLRYKVVTRGSQLPRQKYAP